MSEPEKCKCFEATDATRAMFPGEPPDWRSESCWFLREMMRYRFPDFEYSEMYGCICPECERSVCSVCIIPF